MVMDSNFLYIPSLSFGYGFSFAIIASFGVTFGRLLKLLTVEDHLL